VPRREGAIDRLVNIYKDVVHKTGVSVSLYTVSVYTVSVYTVSVSGLPDGEWLRHPGPGGADHAGGGRGRGQHLQEAQRGRREILISRLLEYL